MKRMSQAVLLSGVLLLSACHKNHGDSGDTGLPHYTTQAGPFAGTINGEQAGTFLYKSGDRVYGNMSLGNRSFRYTGFNDPNVMDINAESPAVAGFTRLVFYRTGNTWNIVEGGTGFLAQQ